MKVATSVWLAIARLQHEYGLDADFAVGDAIEAALLEAGPDANRQSIAAHISSHCVATCRPSPDRYRMLTRTTRGRVRLFREGDPYHPDRRDGATVPRPEDVPAASRHLLGWYTGAMADCQMSDFDSIVRELRELGEESGLWKGVDPDDYVASLRAGWDS